jgi:hypothetical protein
MATASEIQTRIDEIDAKLASGVSSSTVGDLRTDYDLTALRNERNRLEARLSAIAGATKFRRVVMKNA